VPKAGADQTPAAGYLRVRGARTTLFGAYDAEFSLETYEAGAPTYELSFGNGTFEHLRTVHEDLLLRYKLLCQAKGN
jgi:hypothetical protein